MTSQLSNLHGFLDFRIGEGIGSVFSGTIDEAHGVTSEDVTVTKVTKEVSVGVRWGLRKK